MGKIRKTIFTSLLVVLSLNFADVAMAQFNANTNNVRDLVRRIQTDTNSLRNSIQTTGNRGTYRVNELNQLITNLEAATLQLDRRLGGRRDTSTDARLVLDRATALDSFFANSRIGSSAQRDWQTLRSDIDQLARAYNLNWQANNGSYPGSSNSTRRVTVWPRSRSISSATFRTRSAARCCSATFCMEPIRKDPSRLSFGPAKFGGNPRASAPER